MKIPGLSFSWKRTLGISQAKQQFARQTGIPTTEAGLERKIGRAIIQGIFGKLCRPSIRSYPILHPDAVYLSLASSIYFRYVFMYD